MKKLISIALTLSLCLSFMLIFTSCGKEDSFLKYGKKYTYKYESSSYIYPSDTFTKTITNYQTFVFNKNQTGTYDYRHCIEYDSEEDDVVKSYTINFKWRWADTDKGSICIFETKRTYNDDHTEEEKGASISDYAFIVGEEFICCAANSNRFILESSDVFEVEYDLEMSEEEL